MYTNIYNERKTSDVILPSRRIYSRKHEKERDAMTMTVHLII
jgi:hypothetical protein